MQYQASVAYRLESSEAEILRQERNFGVLEGGGLDAQARRGVSVNHYRMMVMIALAGLFIAALGIFRVAISAATVAQMSEVSSLRADITEAKYSQSNLLIVKSSLSSSSRIDRIATQNYGMVYPTSTDTVEVATEDAQTSVDALQSQQSGAQTN